MKRTILSLILVFTMVCSYTFGVSAAVDNVDSLSHFLRNSLVVGDIQVGANGSYSDSLAVSANANFSAKATLDMTHVKRDVGRAYDELDPSKHDELNAKPVSGTFNITIDFGTGISELPEVATTGSLSGFKFDDSTTSDIFEEVAASRTVSGKTVSMTIKVKDGVTAEKLRNLPSIITLECPGLKTFAGTTISGTISGSATIGDLGTVNYKFVDKNYTDYDLTVADCTIQPATVTIRSSSGGSVSSGGSSITETEKFSLSYESNGGTVFDDETYTKGKVVKIDKTPEKEGYTFAGWYSDKALTNKVTSVTMDADITLYAAWDEVIVPLDLAPVPEMLNGDDHFAYINGYDDGTVRPNSNITRAEVAIIFFRLLKDEVRDKYLTRENTFADVNADDAYNTAISTMANAGIVNGRSEGEFAPDEYITRAEFTTICARFNDSNSKAENAFTDIDLHWASEYILEAVSYGWIEGYEDYTFRPDQFIYRAEAITLINRVMHRIPLNTDSLLDGMTTWSDNSDENAWYYVAIQEAANSHKYTRDDNGYETWTELTEAKDWTVYEK